MSIKHLQTPIKAADLQDIHTGDIVYLTGTLVTARDCVHTRLVKQGRALPVDLKEKSHHPNLEGEISDHLKE